MSTELKSESRFLIDLAVDNFNQQYDREIKSEDCDIKSIVPDYGATHGYEIFTKITTDFLRLRIYIQMEEMDRLYPYRLETTEDRVSGALGDEVYVALGIVNQFYLNEGIYRFRWIGAIEPEVTLLGFL